MRLYLLFHAFLITLMFVPFLPASAEEKNTVTLKAHEGDFLIKGTLIKYDENHYVLKSEFYGVMTVDNKRFACIGSGCPKAEARAQSITPQKIDFGIYGSNTIGSKLMPLLIENYAKTERLKVNRQAGAKNDELLLHLEQTDGAKLASIDLRAHGSSASFSALSDGVAQIGMSSRPIKPYEKAELIFKKGGPEPDEHVLALDAIAVIVSPRKRIEAISVEQLAKIFSGEIRNWSELGLHQAPIKVYARDKDSGTFDSFHSIVLKPYGKKLLDTVKRYSSNKELAKAVKKDPNAIGFVGFAYAKSAKALAISNQCGLKRAPTKFNIKTLEYPLTRKLFLYTTSKTKHPVAHKLLKYATSKRAERIIEKSGFISQSVGKMSFHELGDVLVRSFSSTNPEADIVLLKNFVETFQNSKRLTTTFRFKPNTVFLEAKSAEQIMKLGKVMFDAAVNKNKIYLVGFSDSAGDFEQNRQIALLRAQQVKNTLLEAFGNLVPKEQLVTKSYSELLPVDCNKTAKGRHNNRRVEVWISG